jgi:hypothetical protein
MPRHKNYFPHGVIRPSPAVHDDLSIDEANFQKALRDVTAAEGLSAVTINAHSTEVASCTFDEQKRVLDIAGRRNRRQVAAGQRHLGRRQPRAARLAQNGDRRRRLARCWCSRRGRSPLGRTSHGDRSTSSASPTPPTCR